ncbi:MAG TPA: fumarylacetoacetate hydrolase, partial [Methylococcaceae bacterium]|nr:fumarylacetoacetate hydrolase [Methylococcaceae bacterium]
MKLATFSHSNQTRVGAVVGQEMVDSTGLIVGLTTMVDFINLGGRAIAAMDQRIAQGSDRFDLDAVKLEAPILQPTKYLAISLNYADHISETGLEKPEFPSFFNKQTSC